MKIIKAINSIIENESLITNVIQSKDEFFFLYNNKYKWSINLPEQTSDDLYIHFYVNEDLSIEKLSKIQDQEWELYNFITYKISDFKTIEASESFHSLYQIVKSKVYGVDDILDDIISGK